VLLGWFEPARRCAERRGTHAPVTEKGKASVRMLRSDAAQVCFVPVKFFERGNGELFSPVLRP
jgi:hypothetical protein